MRDLTSFNPTNAMLPRHWPERCAELRQRIADFKDSHHVENYKEELAWREAIAEIEHLRNALETLEMHALRDISPGWVSIPESEWDGVFKPPST